MTPDRTQSLPWGPVSPVLVDLKWEKERGTVGSLWSVRATLLPFPGGGAPQRCAFCRWDSCVCLSASWWPRAAKGLPEGAPEAPVLPPRSAGRVPAQVCPGLGLGLAVRCVSPAPRPRCPARRPGPRKLRGTRGLTPDSREKSAGGTGSGTTEPVLMTQLGQTTGGRLAGPSAGVSDALPPSRPSRHPLCGSGVSAPSLFPRVAPTAPPADSWPARRLGCPAGTHLD